MALSGLRVLELAGLAPSPYAGLILKQHGADVIRVDRAEGNAKDPSGGAMGAGKRAVALDLKSAQGRNALLALARSADVLIEPFRPGVLEKLGLGPDVLLAANPRLIVARLTGWGQGDSEFARSAGHDINYLSVTGVLAWLQRSGEGERPFAPLNLLGDFAAGGLLCVTGILMALWERERSGRGQVVDAAMVDGVSHLATFVFRARAKGAWADSPGTNVLDGGAPFYDTYVCRDGRHMAVGAIEPHFFKLLLRGLGLEREEGLPAQMDRARWPALRARIAQAFLTRSRDEWTEVFSGPLKDACCTPVLTATEAAGNSHIASRSVLHVGPDGPDDLMPAPAPRLARTPGYPSPMGPRAVPREGQHTREVLLEAGLSEDHVEGLLRDGHAVQHQPRSRSKL